LLAERLREHAGRDDVVASGCPVAACRWPSRWRALDAPLDVFLVRKLGVPGHEEYAFGAIATSGTRVLDKQSG
jgi:predicted phosphoribosyltransferase